MNMLSRLHGAPGRFTGLNNIISKRWSGHNAMNIEPSNYGWKHFKDMAHLYFMLTMVPVSIITTIINIRANPVLSEVPDGYEPRHWEYYKHPLTRFMARYVFMPMETDHECRLSWMEFESQHRLVKQLQRKVEHTMRFYNDHRTLFFTPRFAEYWRIGRDQHMRNEPIMRSNEGHFLDYAYDPNINPVPTEGYKPPESRCNEVDRLSEELGQGTGQSNFLGTSVLIDSHLKQTPVPLVLELEQQM